MFTGIVQGIGQIEAIAGANAETRFTIKPLFPFSDPVNGESIAINGACLSMETHTDTSFSVYASRETLAHTALGNLRSGNYVNLERALAVGDRLGGHLVSGHVDCVATVAHLENAASSLLCRVNFPDQFSSQIINRGSITLDGISLTITACGKGFLQVNIIPDSQKRTNIFTWHKGVKLNMETDLIGKYVANYLRAMSDPPTEQSNKKISGEKSTLDMDFLARNGFI